jgi:hypothetical protein
VIVNLVVTGLLGLVTWLTSFLPAGAPWSPDVSAVSGAIGSLYAIDAYVPITEALICVGIAIAVMNARLPFTLVVWIYTRIRG